MDANATNVWPLPAELLPPVEFPRGMVISTSGKLNPWVRIVARGRIRLFASLAAAREMRVADLSNGSAIGVASAVLRAPDHATAVVLEACEVYSVPAERFRRLIETDADAAAWAARALASETRRLSMAIARFGARAEIRLLMYFAELFVCGHTELADGSFRLSVAPTQEEIGQAIGVTREHVNALLAELEKKDVIRRQNGRVIVPPDSHVLELRDNMP